MALNYVTVTGNLGLRAPLARLTFTPSLWLTDPQDNLYLPPAPVVAYTTMLGVFSVPLLATDNGSASPGGWQWTVTIDGIAGVPGQSFSFFLPITSGVTQDISHLAGVQANTYRLMDGLNGRPGSGPASAAPYAGNFTAGVLWKVTSGGLWFTGYWAWVPSNGDTTPRKCALWQLTDTTHGTSQVLVPGSVVTSITLTRGAWNFIALPAPLALSASVPYCAAQGWVASAGFPDTQNQFGVGNTYAAGITNGPLVAYSDQGGSAPEPFSSDYHQMVFSTGTADPSVSMPTTGDVSSNLWVDVQISDQAPAGAVSRLWPSQPYAVGWNPDTNDRFTLGTQFSVLQSCRLFQIEFYSPAGSTQLPTECAIYVDSNQSVLPGSDNASPAWKRFDGSSANPGDGWVYCDYSAAGVSLTKAANYKSVVCNSNPTLAVWSAQTGSYWTSPGPGQNGITNGIVSAPNNANADVPGQSSYHLGSVLHWPDTTAGLPTFNYWVGPVVMP